MKKIINQVRRILGKNLPMQILQFTSKIANKKGEIITIYEAGDIKLENLEDCDVIID